MDAWERNLFRDFNFFGLGARTDRPPSTLYTRQVERFQSFLPRPHSARVVSCLAAFALAISGHLLAQSDSPSTDSKDEIPGVKLIDPRSYGFRVSPNFVETPTDMRVLVQREDQTEVAKVHAKVGDAYILLMPDGRLIDRKVSEVQVTDQPFEPVDADELIKRLRVGPLADFNVMKSKNYVYLYNTSESYGRSLGGFSSRCSREYRPI